MGIHGWITVILFVLVVWAYRRQLRTAVEWAWDRYRRRSL